MDVGCAEMLFEMADEHPITTWQVLVRDAHRMQDDQPHPSHDVLSLKDFVDLCLTVVSHYKTSSRNSRVATLRSSC
jgi:hypothetical protein